MTLTEFTSIKHLTYLEYCSYLQKKYGMSSVGRVIHFLLQMIPVLDIIDGLYISIKYWNRGRGLAVVTFAFTLSITALVLSIYLAIRFI